MTQHATIASQLTSRIRANSWLVETTLILTGSLLIALSAQVAVPLAFSPVPVTAQTFVVLLIGALFGSRRGAATVIAYLSEGACGLPFFAEGTGSAAILLGPTGGYLIGFVGAAYLTGWLAERGWDRGLLSTAAAMVLGNVVIYITGLAWLSSFVGSENVLSLGFYPFIPGAVVKIALAAMLLPTAWKLIRRF